MCASAGKRADNAKAEELCALQLAAGESITKTITNAAQRLKSYAQEFIDRLFALKAKTPPMPPKPKLVTIDPAPRMAAKLVWVEFAREHEKAARKDKPQVGATVTVIFDKTVAWLGHVLSVDKSMLTIKFVVDNSIEKVPVGEARIVAPGHPAAARAQACRDSRIAASRALDAPRTRAPTPFRAAFVRREPWNCP